MTKAECDRVVRMIESVFQYEQSVAPETISAMFKLIGNLLASNNLESNEMVCS